jgi:hypothetical protein
MIMMNSPLRALKAADLMNRLLLEEKRRGTV